MLLELSVQNLVIVGQARLAPGAGLTAVSGETGAGKSLLLDALELLLGGRASARLIGPRGDSATVSAVCQVDTRLARRIEERCGVPCGDGQVILRRRIGEGGRSQAWINDVPVTAAALRAVGDDLVEVHAQHEALRLAETGHQLALIDRHGGIEEQAERYAALHRSCLDLAQELAHLDGGERESLKELDFLRFQEQELSALAPKPGELAELETRQRQLTGAEEWQRLAAEAQDALIEGERAAATVLGRLAKRLSQAPDPQLAEAGAACARAAEEASEAARACAAALDRLHADPAALARIEERLDAWYQLMRKHGDGEQALLDAWQRVRARIAELEGLDARRAACAERLQAARAERDASGATLAKARRSAFARLAKEVHRHLADLGMPKARVELAERALAEPGPAGTVAQELVVSTNPGLPAGRLAEIASGGEQSRVALAIAAATAAGMRTPILVFDEIDSGVGGRLGGIIGAKLAELARGRTVIAITHTPHLAAMADRQYVVRKQQGERETSATAEEVSGASRTREIAEMLGGGPAALGQAKALLGAAR